MHFLWSYIFVGEKIACSLSLLCKKSKRNIHAEVIYLPSGIFFCANWPSGKFGCLAIVSKIYKTDTKIVYALRNAFWST